MWFQYVSMILSLCKGCWLQKVCSHDPAGSCHESGHVLQMTEDFDVLWKELTLGKAAILPLPALCSEVHVEFLGFKPPASDGSWCWYHLISLFLVAVSGGFLSPLFVVVHLKGAWAFPCLVIFFRWFCTRAWCSCFPCFRLGFLVVYSASIC